MYCISDQLWKIYFCMICRFALKQERLDNLGQWKFNDATNPEWNKQALSWPVKADGKRNEVGRQVL